MDCVNQFLYKNNDSTAIYKKKQKKQTNLDSLLRKLVVYCYLQIDCR